MEEITEFKLPKEVLAFELDKLSGYESGFAVLQKIHVPHTWLVKLVCIGLNGHFGPKIDGQFVGS
ncbi:hypothetical protein AQ505_12420 [Pedobacter sp. PACM 27299]|nr:hypothetical protein AQ505_12420 [Pedobacter sp. PACM 27299]